MRLLVLFLVAAASLFAAEKAYLPFEDLTFSEGGIYLIKEGCLINLPAVAFDPELQSYYFEANQQAGRTLVWCGCCKLTLYWLEQGCCLNGRCYSYCYGIPDSH